MDLFFKSLRNFSRVYGFDPPLNLNINVSELPPLDLVDAGRDSLDYLIENAGLTFYTRNLKEGFDNFYEALLSTDPVHRLQTMKHARANAGIVKVMLHVNAEPISKSVAKGMLSADLLDSISAGSADLFRAIRLAQHEFGRASIIRFRSALRNFIAAAAIHSALTEGDRY